MTRRFVNVDDPIEAPDRAEAIAAIFLEARTANAFSARPVAHAVLERAVELALLGPTSSNTIPLRVTFVESTSAKERLRPALSPGNVAKTMAAPLTAILAADLRFYEFSPRTNPERGEALVERFGAMDADARRTFARDNALLQMGYVILAVRALGLDAGPMGGFDRNVVDAAFFPDGRLVSLYLVNVGYADRSALRPRSPRLDVAGVVRFV